MTQTVPANAPAGIRSRLRQSRQRRMLRRSMALYTHVLRDRPRTPSWTPARVTLLAVAGLLVAGGLVCAVLGVVLLVRGPAIAGVGLLLVALVVRPRLGRPSTRKARLDRRTSPDLFTVIDDISSALGTPPPAVVSLGTDLNTFVRAFGVRRRTELRIGVRLWLLLGPQARVAVLAHEMGHLVNGDPMRSFLVQPAAGTFGRLALWTGAGTSWDHGVVGVDRRRHGFFLRVALYLLSRLFLAIYLMLVALGWRGHQEAEYLADGFSARVAGKDGAVEAFEVLTCTRDALIATAYAAENTPPVRWPALVRDWIDGNPAEVEDRAQASMERLSLLDSHPPHKLRLDRVRAAEPNEPIVLLSEQANGQIDANLAGWYRAVHGRVLGTRDYRGPLDRTALGWRPPRGVEQDEHRHVAQAGLAD